ncbi:MAG: hypothetical protein QOF44_4555 [Streptomyces sp.]|nr:hypothetical protein [Streptomyces sp.]
MWVLPVVGSDDVVADGQAESAARRLIAVRTLALVDGIPLVAGDDDVHVVGSGWLTDSDVLARRSSDREVAGGCGWLRSVTRRRQLLLKGSLAVSQVISSLGLRLWVHSLPGPVNSKTSPSPDLRVCASPRVTFRVV